MVYIIKNAVQVGSRRLGCEHMKAKFTGWLKTGEAPDDTGNDHLSMCIIYSWSAKWGMDGYIMMSIEINSTSVA